MPALTFNMTQVANNDNGTLWIPNKDQFLIKRISMLSLSYSANQMMVLFVSEGTAFSTTNTTRLCILTIYNNTYEFKTPVEMKHLGLIYYNATGGAQDPQFKLDCIAVKDYIRSHEGM